MLKDLIGKHELQLTRLMRLDRYIEENLRELRQELRKNPRVRDDDFDLEGRRGEYIIKAPYFESAVEHAREINREFGPKPVVTHREFVYDAVIQKILESVKED